MFPSPITLTGLVQSFNVDKRYRALQLFSPDQSESRDYSFDKINRNKGLSKFRNAASTAGVIQLTGKDRISARLHTMRDKKELPDWLVKWFDGAGKLNMTDRVQERLTLEAEDLNDIQDRTLNKLCYDLLKTGIISISEDAGVVSSYDFGLTGAASAGVPWTTIASSTPSANIKAGIKFIREKWGMEPTKLLMSTDALTYFMQSGDKDLLGEASKDMYATQGYVRELCGLQVELDDSGYDVSGTFTPHLSSDGTKRNMVLILADGVVGSLVSTHPIDTKAPEGLFGKFAKIYAEEDPAIHWLLQTQTVLPGLTMPNKVYALTAW